MDDGAIDARSERFEANRARLLALTYRILGDRQEAEEVLQDVFVQIWEKAAAFDASLGTPTNWVIRIARNRSIDRLRARQRRHHALDEFENAVAAEPPAPPAPRRSRCNRGRGRSAR